MTKFKKLAKTLTAGALALIMVMSVPFSAQAQHMQASVSTSDEMTQEEFQDLVAELEAMLAEMFANMQDLIFLTEEAREIALDDFEYFEWYLLEIFPQQNIVGRVFDYTLEEILDMMWLLIYRKTPLVNWAAILMPERWGHELEDDLDIAAAYMFSLILMLAFDIEMLGHVGPQLDIEVHHYLFGAMQFFYALEAEFDEDEEIEEGFTSYIIDAFSLDIYHLFYSTFDSVVSDYLILNNPATLWFYGLNPDEWDLNESQFGILGTFYEDNITTKIIEEGRIAYLRIDSFINDPDLDAETLMAFYEEIQGFDHLIIDITGNPGGFTTYFPLNVVRPLIADNLYFRHVEFFMSSFLTEHLFEYPLSLNFANLYDILPAGEFVQSSQGMDMFNQDDLRLLDYAIVWETVYTPSENGFPFEGRIWLLTDEWSASASVAAAQMSVETGFATVVGEPTNRISGTIHTFITLPQTGVAVRVDLGYTTDSRGRSIEEFGVVPDIANMDGMDALETTLAIIGLEKDVDGEVFVPLRQMSYIFGASVNWDAARSLVVIVNASGTPHLVSVPDVGGFIEDGTSWVPRSFIETLF